MREGRPFFGKPRSPFKDRAKNRLAVLDPTYHNTAPNLKKYLLLIRIGKQYYECHKGWAWIHIQLSIPQQQPLRETNN